MNTLHSPSGTSEQPVVITRVTDAQWHAVPDDLVVGRGDMSRRSDDQTFVSIDAWQVDETNDAALALFEGVGTRRAGGNLALVRA